MASARASVRINPGQLQRLLRGRDGAVGRMMAGFAGLSTTACRDVARERTTPQTGRYIASIRSTTEGSPSGVRVVTSSITYAGAPEKPTRPHVIVPRAARVLRFTVGGRVVFATRVNHPGTAGKNVLRDGVRRAGRQIGRIAGG